MSFLKLYRKGCASYMATQVINLTSRQITNRVRSSRCASFGLPDYTLLEEIINSFSHAIGAVFGIVALVMMLMVAVPTGNAIAIVSTLVYGISLIVLYANSAIYHGWRIGKTKKVFQVLDHCTIFMLIAGTYAPFSLLCIGGTTGTIVFACVSCAGLFGIILNIIDMNRFKVISMVCYLVTGWCILFAMKPLIDALTSPQLALLVAGGVAYTIGAAVYGVGGKVRYMHSLWHLFVLAGSVLQFLSVYDYLCAL